MFTVLDISVHIAIYTICYTHSVHLSSLHIQLHISTKMTILPLYLIFPSKTVDAASSASSVIVAEISAWDMRI